MHKWNVGLAMSHNWRTHSTRVFLSKSKLFACNERAGFLRLTKRKEREGLAQNYFLLVWDREMRAFMDMSSCSFESRHSYKKSKNSNFLFESLAKDWYENFLCFLLWSKQSELLTGGINKNLLEGKNWLDLKFLGPREIFPLPHLNTSIFSRNVGDGRFWEEKNRNVQSKIRLVFLPQNI